MACNRSLQKARGEICILRVLQSEEIEPYLFLFKRECLSPRRFSNESNDFRYDPFLQMCVTTEDDKVLAIESSRIQQRETKKADIEKGEDQKDGHSGRW
jgi:hypothetical protein